MAPLRKARTVKLSRAGAPYRAQESTRLEGGRLSEQQRAMIVRYREGSVPASELLAAARRRVTGT